MRINEFIDFLNEEPAVGNKSFSRRMPRSPTIAGWTPPNTNNNLQPITYIGPNARNWDNNSARRAQEMERDGSTPEEIWRDTRTIRGVDGAWRQEIDDSESNVIIDNPDIAQIDNKTFETDGGTIYKADEVFDHPELYDAYPELRDYSIIFYDNSNDLGSRGWADKENRIIGIGAYDTDPETFSVVPTSSEEIRNVMAHELGGHGVQSLEPEFERGGALLSFSTVDTAGKIANTEFDFNDPDDKFSNLWRTNDVYQGYGGEIDARSIQNRLNMDDNERSANMPRFNDSPIIVLRRGEVPPNLANQPSMFIPGTGAQDIFPDITVIRNPNYSGNRTSVREPTPRNTPPVSTPRTPPSGNTPRNTPTDAPPIRTSPPGGHGNPRTPPSGNTPRNTPPVSTPRTPPSRNTPRNTPPVSTPTNMPPIRTSPPGGHRNPRTTRKTEDIAASAIIHSNKIFNEARKKIK